MSNLSCVQYQLYSVVPMYSIYGCEYIIERHCRLRGNETSALCQGNMGGISQEHLYPSGNGRTGFHPIRSPSIFTISCEMHRIISPHLPSAINNSLWSPWNRISGTPRFRLNITVHCSSRNGRRVTSTFNGWVR